MATSVSRASNNKIGTCPHGLPLGACPICNGMGGGGGSVKKNNKPAEMSWNECYSIGQMMKAQKLAKQHTQQMFAAQDLRSHLNNLQTQINAMKMAALTNLPRPIAKAVTVLADMVLTPMVKVLQTVVDGMKNLTVAVTKAIDNIKQKIVDIADKLTAMFGEAKAAIQKKIDEKFKDIKKKIFNLFGIVGAENEEDESDCEPRLEGLEKSKTVTPFNANNQAELKKVEEEKRLFELNTAKEALFEMIANNEIIPEKDESEEE